MRRCECIFGVPRHGEPRTLQQAVKQLGATIGKGIESAGQSVKEAFDGKKTDAGDTGGAPDGAAKED